MKLIHILCAIILFPIFSLLGQSPELINYQAVIKDETNTALINKRVTLRFYVLKDSVGGNILYAEDHHPNTGEQGIINLLIGGGFPVTGKFSNIDWSDGPFFIRTDIDTEGGIDFVNFGTQRLVSVPFSLYSRRTALADSVIGLDQNYRFRGIDSIYISNDTLYTIHSNFKTYSVGYFPQFPSDSLIKDVYFNSNDEIILLFFNDSTKNIGGLRNINTNGIVSTIDNGDGTFTFNYSDGTSFTTTDLTGSPGISISSANIINDSLYLSLSNGQSLNAGHVKGDQGTPGLPGQNGQDGVGITSATNNGNGTFTINFTDGSSFTTADLTGSQGPQGATGPQGQAGTSITATNIVNDSLYISLSNGQTINTGYVKGDTGPAGIPGLNGQDGVGITSATNNGNGTFTLNFTDGSSFTTADLTGPQGPQGATGPQGQTGTGITATNIVNDSLYISLSNGQNINAGYVKGDTGSAGLSGQNGVGITSATNNGNGTFTINFTDGSSFTTADLTGPQGQTGISVSSSNIINDSLYITLSDGQTLNAGLAKGEAGLPGQDGIGIVSTVDNGDGTFTFNYSDGSSFTTPDLKAQVNSPWSESGDSVYLLQKNVGIGTEKPQSRLTVSGGNASFGMDVTEGENIITFEGGRLQAFRKFSNGNLELVDAFNNRSILRFYRNSDNVEIPNGSLFVDDRVGIGTTSPDAPLTIGDGGDQNGFLHVKRNDNPHINLFEGTTSLARIQGDITNGHPQFQIVKANGTDPMFVVNQDDGNVGINTTNPDEKLQVAGNIRVGNALIFSAAGRNSYVTNNINPFVYSSPHNFHGTSSMHGSLILQSRSTANRPIVFVTGSTPNERMRVNGNGRVGIGTKNPEGQLHLADIMGNGGRNLIIGDDAFFTDVDKANGIGLYGMQNPSVGRLKLGSSGPWMTGENDVLYVCGSIRSNEVKVEVINWCDYVFDPSYELNPLEKVEAFIKENRHLPEIPSEEEVYREGIDLGDMQARLLLKIEELTLYTIELNKKYKALKDELESMKSKK